MMHARRAGPLTVACEPVISAPSCAHNTPQHVLHLQAAQQQSEQAGGGGGSSGGTGLPSPPPAYMQQLYVQQALAEELQKFWLQMSQDVADHSDVLADFKNQALPLARIKKVSGRHTTNSRSCTGTSLTCFAACC
jgi:hypothetical protein